MAKDLGSKSKLDKAIERWDYLFWAVISILGVGVITMIFMVAGMVIQAWQTRPIPQYYGNQQQIIDKLNKIEAQQNIQVIKTGESTPPQPVPNQ